MLSFLCTPALLWRDAPHPWQLLGSRASRKTEGVLTLQCCRDDAGGHGGEEAPAEASQEVPALRLSSLESGAVLGSRASIRRPLGTTLAGRHQALGL